MVITRFAPSPTGLLHLGHAYSALFAWQQAQTAGGLFLLRIEDIDPVRCRPEFISAITDDLAWLGLSWPQPVRHQSHHLADYQSVLDRLRADGLVYPCFCSRKDIEAEIARSGHAPHGPDGFLYPGTCRQHKDRHNPHRSAECCWRLDMAEALRRVDGTRLRWHDQCQGWQQAHPHIFGDVVLARKDVPTSYHLSVVWDDAVQGVTLVTRGQDLFQATHIHCLLHALLDLPTPAYHHHPLLTDAQGRRYAKRDKSLTLASLRAEGKNPQHIRSMMALSP